ncbi:hypothetical protein OMK64_06505 [Cellulomonas fimi]|uniref:hypothetical protein n=1 Tax=Cellulomonas fimi TaxID=1708 RepID=UPI00234E0BAA|nr:hypothetical protein [Cellulomonas fimi]MDC7121183.1 hypothetical protein [Cellulomonas fimi]
MSSGPRMAGAHRLDEGLWFVRVPEQGTRVVDGGTLLVLALDVRPVDGGEPGGGRVVDARTDARAGGLP